MSRRPLGLEQRGRGRRVANGTDALPVTGGGQVPAIPCRVLAQRKVNARKEASLAATYV